MTVTSFLIGASGFLFGVIFSSLKTEKRFFNLRLELKASRIREKTLLHELSKERNK